LLAFCYHRDCFLPCCRKAWAAISRGLLFRSPCSSAYGPILGVFVWVRNSNWN